MHRECPSFTSEGVSSKVVEGSGHPFSQPRAQHRSLSSTCTQKPLLPNSASLSRPLPSSLGIQQETRVFMSAPGSGRSRGPGVSSGEALGFCSLLPSLRLGPGLAGGTRKAFQVACWVLSRVFGRPETRLGGCGARSNFPTTVPPRGQALPRAPTQPFLLAQATMF